MSDTRFTAATKLDANKPPMELIPWEAMVGVAQVLDFGRVKYAAHNWRKGFQWGRLAAAALRHIFAWLSGQENDPESGLSHIDHATCCLMFLSAHIKGELGEDDRAQVLLAADRPERRPPTAPTRYKITFRGRDSDIYKGQRFYSEAAAWDTIGRGPDLRGVEGDCLYSVGPE
jgi:hypothetical protein